MRKKGQVKPDQVSLKADTPKSFKISNIFLMLQEFIKHRPFHLYLDDKIYFVTASTLNKINYFDSDLKKKIIKKRLLAASEKYKVRSFAWVILSNHYHLLFQFKEKQKLADFIGFVNGGSSFELNSLENKKRRKTWWNYWDNCIRDSKTFYRRFNYIHYNPVKHNYVKNCKDYKFSSYNYYLKKLGQSYMDSIFEAYPIIDFTDKNDRF